MLHTVQCHWQRSWITFCDFVFVQLLQREKNIKFKKDIVSYTLNR